MAYEDAPDARLLRRRLSRHLADMISPVRLLLPVLSLQPVQIPERSVRRAARLVPVQPRYAWPSPVRAESILHDGNHPASGWTIVPGGPPAMRIPSAYRHAMGQVVTGDGSQPLQRRRHPVRGLTDP